MGTKLDRCLAYLSKLPPALSGSGGHNATLRAACECVRFGLADVEAMQALREYNRRCSPPWTERELAHKLESARHLALNEAGTRGAPSRRRWQRPAPIDLTSLPRLARVAVPVSPTKNGETAQVADNCSSAAADNFPPDIPASIREFAEWAGATVEELL